MPDDQKKIVPIDYTHREFQSIRQDLIDIAERFYPNTFKDFSEASFGALVLDAVAYVGDQMSFYLDYNVNETFMDTAYEYDNVLRQGRTMGYKYTGRPSTYGKAAIYLLIPASSTAIGPDTGYLPVLKRGSRFSSTTGVGFTLTENIDFSDAKHPTVVAKVNTNTGAPTYFAKKAYGNVVSGIFNQEGVTVGSYERFKRIKLKGKNISEIISVTDTEGNEYFEVGYLAQDMIYKEMPNNNYKNDNVPSIIKPYLVSRKFVVEQDRYNTYLQFGSGDTSVSNVVADPQSVALDVFGKTYTTDTTFDPTKLSKNQNFGITPTNTTLTIVYRSVNPNNSNVGAGALTNVTSPILQFKNREQLTTTNVQEVVSSIEVSNEEPIVGNVTNVNTTELKRRVYDTFSTQNRAVTQADYENVTYRMPAKFGSIARCSVQRDPDSNKRNLNMYVISENQFGKLTATNSTIKNNLKTWLNDYRMLADTIDILDAYVINLGIEFVAKASVGVDKFAIVDAGIRELQSKFATRFYIGEPLYISDIYSALKDVTGILDVTAVKLVNKNSSQYAGTNIDINSNISPDGTYLIAPKNAIFEIKFPEVDIKGKIK